MSSHSSLYGDDDEYREFEATLTDPEDLKMLEVLFTYKDLADDFTSWDSSEWDDVQNTSYKVDDIREVISAYHQSLGEPRFTYKIVHENDGTDEWYGVREPLVIWGLSVEYRTIALNQDDYSLVCWDPTAEGLESALDYAKVAERCYQQSMAEAREDGLYPLPEAVTA